MKKIIIYLLTVICLVTLCGCVRVDFSYDGNNAIADTTALDIQSDSKSEEKGGNDEVVIPEVQYEFRNESLWNEHFKKHGEEFPYETKEDYLDGANKALSNPNILHKTEADDGDHVYYLEETNEIIFVSKDGYIRTYFKPAKGKKYFDKQ